MAWVQSHKRVIAVLTLILVLQLTMSLFYGQKKAGFYEDEMATFVLANHPGSFVAWSDGLEQWQPGSFFTDALTTNEETAYTYSIPYQNQESDVHPPLYYFVIHTASSLFSGHFSKWIGIAPNIVFALVTTVLLYFCACCLTSSKILPFAVCGAWALSAGAMSMIVFIRMYTMLTLEAVLLLLLHLRFFARVCEDEVRIRNMIPLFLCTVCGILTQYYFLIYCFFLCGFFVLLLLIERKLWLVLSYALSEFAAVGACIVVFPKMIFHILGGYRGTEAIANLESSDFLQNLGKVLSLISNQIAGGWLSELLTLLILIGVAIFLRVRVGFRPSISRGNDIYTVQIKWERPRRGTLRFSIRYCLLLGVAVVVIGYISVVAKIAPYRVDRYYFIIYPMIYLVLGLVFYGLCSFMIKKKEISAVIVSGLLLILVGLGQHSAGCNYLFEARQDRTDQLAKYAGMPAIVTTCSYSWSLDRWTNEYQNYSEVFYCKNQDFSGLSTAIENPNLENGFLLYFDQYSIDKEEEVFAAVSEYVDIADYEFVTSTGNCLVYFCHLMN